MSYSSQLAAYSGGSQGSFKNPVTRGMLLDEEDPQKERGEGRDKEKDSMSSSGQI